MTFNSFLKIVEHFGNIICKVITCKTREKYHKTIFKILTKHNNGRVNFIQLTNLESS